MIKDSIEKKPAKVQKKSFPSDLHAKAMPRLHEEVAKEMYNNLVKDKNESKGKPPIAQRYCK